MAIKNHFSFLQIAFHEFIDELHLEDRRQVVMLLLALAIDTVVGDRDAAVLALGHPRIVAF
jgi:hypothetical protein